MQTKLGLLNQNQVQRDVKSELRVEENIKLRKDADELDESMGRSRARAIQENLGKTYIVANNRYLDKETKQVIIKDKGTVLKTRDVDPRHAVSMVEIAASKGWSSIKVKGSDDFKKAAWTEAVERGIAVTGYKPSQQEIAWAEDRNKNVKHKNDSPEKESQTKTAKRSVDTDKNYDVVLVKHGSAPYKDNVKNQMSYYATVLDGGAERKIWGAGLSSVLKESGAVAGEKISLSIKNRDSVKVEGKGQKTKVEWDIKRSDDFVKAEKAAKIIISESKLSEPNKQKLYKSLDKEMVKLQDSGKIPKVHVYDTDQKRVSEKKQQISRSNQQRAAEMRPDPDQPTPRIGR